MEQDNNEQILVQVVRRHSAMPTAYDHVSRPFACIEFTYQIVVEPCYPYPNRASTGAC